MYQRADICFFPYHTEIQSDQPCRISSRMPRRERFGDVTVYNTSGLDSSSIVAEESPSSLGVGKRPGHATPRDEPTDDLSYLDCFIPDPGLVHISLLAYDDADVGDDWLSHVADGAYGYYGGLDATRTALDWMEQVYFTEREC